MLIEIFNQINIFKFKMWSDSFIKGFFLKTTKYITVDTFKFIELFTKHMSTL